MVLKAKLANKKSAFIEFHFIEFEFHWNKF